MKGNGISRMGCLNVGCDSLFSSLIGKRIFLTGGTGLFGKWILDYFQALETELVVLSRDPGQFIKKFPAFENQSGVSFVKGDVRDFEYPSGSFDYVIHAATPVVSDDLSDDSEEMVSIIVEGTKRVLEFSKMAKVERLLYVSSGAVYGIQPPELERIPEAHPCNPVTAYGKGKLAAEQLCLDSDVNCVIARCFAFVGPYMPLDEHFAIGNFIGNCLRNEPVEIKGDGTPLRSYMYATDLVEWLIVLLLEGAPRECYNVGSDRAVSIADLACLVRDVAGVKADILIEKKRVQGKLPSRYVPNINKISEQIKLKQKTDLSESIRLTILSQRNSNKER